MFRKIRKFLSRREKLSTILELLGAIAVWWGIWGILDLFIFPESKILSYLTSIVIGSGLLIINGSGLDDIK